MPYFTETTNGVILQLRIIPRAKVSAIAGILGDALKIRLQAPPVDGKANQALLKFLAEKFPQKKIELLSGATGRNKRVLIHGVTGAAVEKILL